MIPKVSIVVPIHKEMKNGPFFLWRLVQSLMTQTFKDYELVIVQDGTMPQNTNSGLLKARGELVKVLYMDDYFAHPDALQRIVETFKPEDMWLATGCLHQGGDEEPQLSHYPEYTEDVHRGNNRIGSPSVITLRNKGHLLFDEYLSFYLDCDLYKRYYDTYGPPTLLNDLNVVIGLGDHQTSYIMPPKEKLEEFNYMLKKHE